MKIFSKKAFALGEGITKFDPDAKSIVTAPGAFQEVPDYIKNDPMFLAASKEGSILIVGDSAQQKAIENGISESPDVTDVEPDSAEKQFFAELKKKSREEAVAMAEASGIKLEGTEKTGKIKAMIMNAWREENSIEESSDTETEEE